MAEQVQQYLLQDLTLNEIASYNNYSNGCIESINWMDKTLDRREKIILSQPTCVTCHGSINVSESGICRCFLGHDGTGVVLGILGELEDSTEQT
jgi:hypothetical protein